MQLAIGLSCAAVVAPAGAAPSKSSTGAPVVLLHGLARSARSMQPMADALAATGRRICNIDYPSTTATVTALAREVVLPAVRQCQGDTDTSIDFVTHSMGGILVRVLATMDQAPTIGRVVMLSPPNQGSELVDRMGNWPPFRWWNGPAGLTLGTDPDSLPAQLGPARFNLGIITGTRSYNPLFSSWIPGPDDGKVSVASARLDGMQAFRTVDASHTFIMRHAEVIELTRRFLQTGHFDATEP